MSLFPHAPEQCLTEGLNRHGRQDGDKDEGKRTIPNFRPQIDVHTNPPGQWLIEPQAGKKNQSPTQQIEYAQYEAAAPAVNGAQQNDHDQDNINKVESSPIHFRASPSFAGGTPAVPAIHLTGYGLIQLLQNHGSMSFVRQKRQASSKESAEYKPHKRKIV